MGRKLFKTFARIMGVTLLMACVCCTKGTEPAPGGGSSNADKTVPTIKIKMDSLFVEVGQIFTIEDGKFLIGDKEVATWSDNETLVGDLAVTLTIDGTSIANGDKVEKEGNLRIKVTDKAKNTSNGFLKLVFYLAPTVIENNIYEDWELMKSKVKTVVSTWYEYYENIGHVHALKVIEELDRSGWNDRERKMSQIYIFCLGEIPPNAKSDRDYGEGGQAYWDLVIGGLYENNYPPDVDIDWTGSVHLAGIVTQVKTRNDKDWIIPGIAQTYRNKIECFAGALSDGHVLAEVKAHPERKYIMGCAKDWAFPDLESCTDHPGAQAWIELANTSNALAFPSIGNVNKYYDYTLSLKELPRERAIHATGSFGPMGRHVIDAVGAHPTYFDWRDYEHEPYEHSRYPIGFTNEDFKVVTTYPMTSFGMYQFARAETSGALASSPASYALVGLAHNILALDPDMSMDEVIDLIHANPYKIPTTINGEPTADSETFDFIAMIKEVNLPKAVQSLSGSAPTELPLSAKFPNVLYTGKGVECFVDGKWMPFTAEYIYDDILFNLAFKAQKFRFNPELWAKQGGKGKAEIKVQLMTADGESIPDIERVMEIAVN